MVKRNLSAVNPTTTGTAVGNIVSNFLGLITGQGTTTNAAGTIVPASTPITTYLLIGGVVVGGYFLLRKRKK
jgi:hypothetical protein